MIINPNEIKSAIYYENHYCLIIDIKVNNPTSITIKEIKNFSEALQIMVALELPIGKLENIQSYY